MDVPSSYLIWPLNSFRNSWLLLSPWNIVSFGCPNITVFLFPYHSPDYSFSDSLIRSFSPIQPLDFVSLGLVLLSPTVYILLLNNFIHFHGFKCKVYANYSHIYLFNANFSFEFHSDLHIQLLTWHLPQHVSWTFLLLPPSNPFFTQSPNVIYINPKHDHATPLFKFLNCFLVVQYGRQSPLWSALDQHLSLFSESFSLADSALATQSMCSSPPTLSCTGASARQVPYTSLGSLPLFVRFSSGSSLPRIIFLMTPQFWWGYRPLSPHTLYRYYYCTYILCWNYLFT